jgi:hypothetical protein
MVDRIQRTRTLVRRAGDLTDDATVREQLQSIVAGLDDIPDVSRGAEPGREGAAESDSADAERGKAGAGRGESDAETGADRAGDRFRTVEAKLAGLTDETDGAARERIEEARDHLDVYRQERTRDW